MILEGKGRLFTELGTSLQPFWTSQNFENLKNVDGTEETWLEACLVVHIPN